MTTRRGTVSIRAGLATLGLSFAAQFGCGSNAGSPGFDAGGGEDSPSVAPEGGSGVASGADGGHFSVDGGSTCSVAAPGCPCHAPGQSQPCETACGAGSMECMAAGEVGGEWGACHAPACADGGMSAPEGGTSTPGTPETWDLALSGTNVYFTEAQNLGGVYVQPQAGGPSVALYGGRPGAFGIALDGSNVYWTELTAGNVMQAPLAGGTPVTLASGQPNPTSVAVDGTSVYWTNVQGGATGGSLNKMPIGGGAVVTLVPQVAGGEMGAGELPNVITVDATSVYYLTTGENGGNPSQVLSVPLGGGEPTVLASEPGEILAIAVDSTNVYYEPNNVLKSVPLNGGSPAVLATVTGSGGGWAIAPDGANVYVLSSDVYSVPVGGGSASLIVSSGSQSGDWLAMAVDSTQVFWTDIVAGTIGRAPK
jgi:hypothetical protein